MEQSKGLVIPDKQPLTKMAEESPRSRTLRHIKSEIKLLLKEGEVTPYEVKNLFKEIKWDVSYNSKFIN